MEINGVCLVCTLTLLTAGAGMVLKLQTPQGHHGGFVTPQASEQVMGVDKDPKRPKHQAGLRVANGGTSYQSKHFLAPLPW